MRTILLSVVLALSGCTTIDRLRTDKPLHDLTTQVTFVGDSQEHEIGGLPARAANGVVDKLNPVTFRPPQQALFGRQYFALLAEETAPRPLIHLGDVLDISCHSEWKRYNAILKSLNQPWALAPGNHDGILNGIFNIRDNEQRGLYGASAWDYGCREFSETEDRSAINDFSHLMSSDEFLIGYLDLKIKKKDIGIINYTNDKQDAFLVAARGRITKRDANCKPRCGDFSESFLIQKIRLPSAPDTKLTTYLILLDTTQWGADSTFEAPEDMNFRPGTLQAARRLLLSPNPGNNGNLLDEQISALNELLKGGKDDIFILAGHHPFAKLLPEARKEVSAALSRLNQPLIYISAHTHTGSWARHSIGDRELLELNINSLADWPIAFRTVNLAISDDRTVIRVSAGLNVTAQDDGIKNFDNFWDSWHKACTRWFPKYDSIAKNHSDIVKAFNNDGMTPLQFATMNDLKQLNPTLPCTYGTPTCKANNADTIAFDWLLYSDKRNAMEKARDVIALSAEESPNFGERLRNDVPLIKAKCGAFADAPSLRQCIQKSFIFDEAHGPQQSEKVFSQLIQQTQEVISNTTDKLSRQYFSCVFAAGAKSDYDENNSGLIAFGKRLLNLEGKVSDTYYYTQMDATR